MEVPAPLSAPSIMKDSKVWVPNIEAIWEVATVLATGEAKHTCRTMTGKVVQVDVNKVFQVNPKVVNDMTALHHIHEPGILYNLSERANVKNPHPYTYMANVLVAVNPLQFIPDPSIASILNNANAEPHPYTVAELAFQQMAYNASAEMQTNQSVVISGESGAGKTESSKIVLKHLTTRGVHGKQTTAEQVEHYKSQQGGLDQRLLAQNPVLEAFGNAKTLRNHNSSRFGKFMKLQFTSDGKFHLTGAFIETYLLERSRLVYQVAGERNFHVFYQMIEGSDAEMKTIYRLKPPTEYHYLNKSGCLTAEGIDDRQDFQTLCHGMKNVGIDAETQRMIFSILAGLLALGNIAFGEEETSEGDAAIILESAEVSIAVKNCCDLLGISPKYLTKVMTEREIVTRDETFTVRRNAQNSVYARDAIAKSLYGAVFDAVISKINLSLGQDPRPLPFIGILDIFGFESFQRNDFEQLLINYTNEVLQATFNKQVFIAELDLYRREGIQVGEIVWPDNRECVELIAGRPNGILSLLDSEAMNPKASDSKFLSQVHRTHRANPFCPRPHPKDMNEIFIVRHFAGNVGYTIGAFIDKNNDSIPRDMVELFTSSSSTLVKTMFDSDLDQVKKSKGPSKRFQSVASKFSKQMQELVETLDATRCNFIRCIKPNPRMRLGDFDNKYVVEQLRCQGIMQTCEVLKVGMPTRVSYDEIVSQYRHNLPAPVIRIFSTQTDATFVAAILWSFRVPMDAYKLGISKVFFKAGQIALLDQVLRINWQERGPEIIKRMKLWLARRRWRVSLAKIISQRGFQRLFNKIKARQHVIVILQSLWRRLTVRRAFLARKVVAQKTQALYRGYAARKYTKEKRADLIAAAEKRAEEKRRQAEAAAKAAEEALRKAEEERKAEENRRRIEAEERSRRLQVEQEEKERLEREAGEAAAAAAAVFAAEEAARKLAAEAAEALREAEEAQLAAEQAVAAEKLAEHRAVREAQLADERAKREADQLSKKMLEAESQAKLRAEQALAALGSAAATRAALKFVSMPAQATTAQREQIEQLNLLLTSGAISQQEYDDLAPFVLEPEVSETQSPENEAVNLDLDSFGVQIRCPTCGEINNTAEGNFCFACGSPLTMSSFRAPSHHMSYGDVHNALPEAYGFGPRSAHFVASGNSVKVHGGTLTVQMDGTQTLGRDEESGYTVYVLRCAWQADDSTDPVPWLVSHRYSAFERLHKDLKRKLPADQMPDFPRKHAMGGIFGGKTGTSVSVVEERKVGLERYMKELLALVGRMPDTIRVPELDRFLNLSAQIDQVRRHAEMLRRGNQDISSNADGPSGVAAELPQPFDAEELVQCEQAVQQLLRMIYNCPVDPRLDPNLQQMLKICVQLQRRLKSTAIVDNPFVETELIPRAMQCDEDMQTAFNLYNDALYASQAVDRGPSGRLHSAV